MWCGCGCVCVYVWGGGGVVGIVTLNTKKMFLTIYLHFTITYYILHITYRDIFTAYGDNKNHIIIIIN